MILARRARSASACCAMARIIVSLRSTCLISTFDDLDAPGVGLRVEDGLDVDVQLVALGEHLVELVLAEHRAQRGLRELAGRLEEVRHLDDRELRVDDAEIDHRVDLHRDVVARDHVLAAARRAPRAQVHAHHLLDARHDDDQARPLDAAGSARAGTPRRARTRAGRAATPRRGAMTSDQDRTVKVEHAYVIVLSDPFGGSPVDVQQQPVDGGDAQVFAACAAARGSARASARRARAPSLRPRCPPAPRRSRRSCSSRPLTTRRRRARSSMPTSRNTNAALAAATPPISA